MGIYLTEVADTYGFRYALTIADHYSRFARFSLQNQTFYTQYTRVIEVIGRLRGSTWDGAGQWRRIFTNENLRSSSSSATSATSSSFTQSQKTSLKKEGIGLSRWFSPPSERIIHFSGPSCFNLDRLPTVNQAVPSKH